MDWSVPRPLIAGSAIFDINLTGRGGHGAIPHQAVDPVVTAAQVILGLQTIISRNIPPLEGAVISVTKVHAGEAFNIIPTGGTGEHSVGTQILSKRNSLSGFTR